MPVCLTVPSGSVTNLNVRDVQATSVELSWGPLSERDNNGIILSYNIYYRLNNATSNVYMEILGVTERVSDVYCVIATYIYVYTYCHRLTSIHAVVTASICVTLQLWLSCPHF